MAKPKPADVTFSKNSNAAEADVWASRVGIHIAMGRWESAHRVIYEAQWAANLDEPRGDPLDWPLAGLPGVSLRMSNILEIQFGAVYLRDLEGVTPRDLMGVENFGARSVEAVRKALCEVLSATGVETAGWAASDGLAIPDIAPPGNVT